jgi:hypothetical protein
MENYSNNYIELIVKQINNNRPRKLLAGGRLMSIIYHKCLTWIDN